MERALQDRLLASINADRLIVLYGAGLSMAPPSELPSARAVANMCYDRHVEIVGDHLDRALRDDLEAFAEHFAANGTLKTVFIDSIVPWKEFVRVPNAGHAAIADILVCRAIKAAISTNYDVLIERRAWDAGAADFQSALDGDEAQVCSQYSPLLKPHGCFVRGRRETIWARSQLHDGEVARHLNKSKIWMAGNLRERDLLVIGFWTDWSYLNTVIGDALTDVAPASITLVDPSLPEVLKEKAATLWDIAHAGGVICEHVQISGATFLEELRTAFSQRWLARVMATGRAALETEIGEACEPTVLGAPLGDVETLYQMRRDAEGVPAHQPPVAKHPPNAEILGLFHLLLRRAGASQAGAHFRGKTIRVVNGAGRILASVRASFAEPPSLPQADIIACVGATSASA